jgi:hypothetical protein
VKTLYPAIPPHQPDIERRPCARDSDAIRR